MKSQQIRSTLIRKPSNKVLNEKKSTGMVTDTLRKQRSKPTLIINNYHETKESITVMNAQIVVSPKNTIISTNNGVMTASVKKELIGEQNVQHEKLLTSGKKLTQGGKIKKAEMSKKQPIKKQSLSTLRSPKTSKLLPTNTIRSQLFLTPFVAVSQHEQQLSISLNASLVKTQHIQHEQQSTILSTSNISNKNNQLQHQELSLSSVKQLPQMNSISIMKQQEISALVKTINQQSEEIVRMKEVNESLERKLNRMKVAQDENKRKLRQRINVFNQQCEEIKQLRERIVQLQKQLHSLQSENDTLRKIITDNDNTLNININQSKQQQIINQSDNKSNNNYSIFQSITLQILPSRQSKYEIDNINNNIKNITIMVDQGVMTNQQDQYMKKQFERKGIQESEKGMYDGLLGIRDLYESKCREKLQQLQKRYDQSILEMRNRLSVFLSECKQLINQHQSQITYLQTKLDNFYYRIYQQSSSPFNLSHSYPNINMDQQQLLHMSEINSYKTKLSQKDQMIKRTKQQVQSYQVQLNAVRAQLQIERIKHGVDYQVTTVKKQLLNLSEIERDEMLHRQLRLLKQLNVKLQQEIAKKQQLIRKLSTTHQYQQSFSNNGAVNKKIRK